MYLNLGYEAKKKFPSAEVTADKADDFRLYRQYHGMVILHYPFNCQRRFSLRLPVGEDGLLG